MKKFIFILVPLFLLSACTGLSALAPHWEPRVVIDQAGRSVDINGPVDKIVSGYYISSSACIALGLGGKMVGIEAKADSRPIYALAAPELLKLPNVGTAKEFNLEACIALEPDLVILPLHLRDSADAMAEMDIPVIFINPEGYEELLEMIALIGNAADAGNKAERMLEYYQDKCSAIEKLTSEIGDNPIVYMGGVDSYLTTAPRDMYQSSLIDIAGGRNAAQEIAGDGWKQISYEHLLAMNPEVIIIPSEAGYDKEDILYDEQLADITAVRNGSIYYMPRAFEAWDSPVPSGVLGMLWLLNVLHEDVYSMETLKNDVSDFYSEFYGIQVDTALISK